MLYLSNIWLQFIICCLLAVASAGLVYPGSYGHDLQSQQGSLYAGHYDYSSNQVGTQSVPHDTEEVAAAKAVHFAAHAEAKARNTYGARNDEPIDTPEVQVAKFQHQLAHAEAKQRLANPALAMPLDTPEVQVAKQEHFAAHAEAKLREAYPEFAQAAGPVDTFEVQQAKLEHFHAKATAEVQEAYGHHDDAGLGESHAYGGYADSSNYGHHGWWFS